MFKFLRFLFWSPVLAFHAACLAGAWSQGWLLGVASDGALLLAEFDAACAALIAIWTLGRPGPSLRISCLLLAVMGCFYAGAPWLGGAAPAPQPPAHAGEPLRLLQGNTQGKGNPYGFAYDAVALSELWTGPLPSPKDMPLVVGAEPGSCDAAIYSRLPVLASGKVGAPIKGWTQAVWARLDWHGKPFTLVSIHTRSPTSLDWAAQRDAFLPVLAGFVKASPPGEPVVLSGDWNATPGDLAFRSFLASGSFSQEPNPWSPTWHSGIAQFGLGFRIDRTLGAHGAWIRSWRALPIGPSDHLASEALIDLGP